LGGSPVLLVAWGTDGCVRFASHRHCSCRHPSAQSSRRYPNNPSLSRRRERVTNSNFKGDSPWAARLLNGIERHGIVQLLQFQAHLEESPLIMSVSAVATASLKTISRYCASCITHQKQTAG